jgi:hypothetical protein
MFSVCLIKGLATLAKLAKGILKSKILTAESFFPSIVFGNLVSRYVIEKISWWGSLEESNFATLRCAGFHGTFWRLFHG